MSLTVAQIQTAYVVFFGRPADPAGLAFWQSFTGGVAGLYRTFAGTPEYASQFDGLNPDQQVALVYRNLLGREPEMAGLTFWSNAIATGRFTTANLAQAIGESAQGTDATTVANRVAAATSFTTALDTVAERLAYSGTAANAAAREWLATVNHTTQATDLTGAAVDASVQAAIAPPAPPAPFTLAISSPEAAEGNAGTTTLSFRLELDRAPTEAVTVNVNTNGGTATAGVDYTPVATSVTFAAGQRVAFVNVAVSGDTAFEADETVVLSVSGARLAATVSATGTISNDDADPQIALGAAFDAAKTASDAAAAAAVTSLDTATTAQAAADAAQLLATNLTAAQAFQTAATAAQTAATAAQTAAAASVTAANAAVNAAAATSAPADNTTAAADLAAATARAGTAATLQAAATADVSAAAAEVTRFTPQTFGLTTGLDSLTGGAGNDVFNALPGAGNANTFSALDIIDGGAGTDTLNVTEINTGTNPTPYTLNDSVTVRNVEVLNYTVASDNGGDTVTANLKTWTGLTTANIVISGTDAPVTALQTKGNVTTVSINGATTVNIDDYAAAGADRLASVTLIDTTGAASIDSDALTSLTLVGSNGGAIVTAAPGPRALALNLNNVTDGTIADANATTLTINTTGRTANGVTVNAAAATTVAINADEALTLTALGVGAATSLTVTGDSVVTLSGATLTALTSIDASAQTAGGVNTSAFALGAGAAFTGGAGADSIKIGATTRAINTGAGDDRVVLDTAVAALGAGGSIDAGAGTDTLVFATADNAHTATATTAFAATISNFEVVELAGAATAAKTLNLANLDNISTVRLTTAAVSQALTIDNLASGGTLAVAVAQTAGTTINVLNAATGTADVVNVSLVGTGVVNSNTLTIANVETINYLTDDTNATGTPFAHVSNLAATAVRTITVAGDAGLTLTNTDITLTTFDASGVTKGAVNISTGNLAAEATLTGGAGNDVINATNAATKSVTLNGGAGNDTLTGGTKADIINGGTGDNTLVGNAGNDTITGGAGNDNIDGGTDDDVIVGGGGADTLAGGTGNDTITGGAGIDSITGGAGNDVIVGGGGADTITGGADADTITLTGNTATIVLTAAADTGSNNATIVQTALLTSGLDVIFGATAGVKIDLCALNNTIATVNLNGTNFVGQDNAVVFTNGTFDAAAGIFNFAANGRDTVMTFDAAAGVPTDFRSIILVGFDAGATTAAAAGVITLG